MGTGIIAGGAWKDKTNRPLKPPPWVGDSRNF